MTKIAIIGGGAAGLMAAARIVELSRESSFERGVNGGGSESGAKHGLKSGGEHENKNEVFLIERNNVLGKKVVISGGGRCNLTTGLEDLKEILKKYPRGANFLRTAMYDFPPTAMREWIEGHGVPLKLEKDMRVFPKSDNGMHVVRAFEKMLEVGEAKVLFKTALKSLKVLSKDHLSEEVSLADGKSDEGGGFVLSFEERADLQVDKVILCTGGKAYKRTGSQGDGYMFAEMLGHTVTALAPSLNAFLLAEKWTVDISGLSFDNVALSFRGKEKFNFSGSIMFTHKGLTGPAVFALSAYAAYEVFDANKPARLFIDFFPGQNHEDLKKAFDRELNLNPKKAFHNILNFFVPKSFADLLCKRLDVEASKLSAELSKKDLNKIIDALKNLPLNIVGRVAGDEFVTAGGVELTEVDSKTMESKLCPGLYFAGEILDYDAFTGGYNLQAAWATGRLAGGSAVT